MIRLSKNQVIELHNQLIRETGGSFGIRDESLLDSALNSPFQGALGVELYPSIREKAARLCYGITRNHPFVDGNKRTGAHTMLVFLYLNGIELCYEQEELVRIIVNVAKGEYGVSRICQWIHEHESTDID